MDNTTTPTVRVTAARSKIGVRQLVSMAMFCAIAFAVMYVSKLIPINVAGFLNLDFKDVVIVICGFMFGPVSAVIVSVLVSFIEMITISGTGIIGFLMNVLSTCAFVCPAAILYKTKHKFSGAIFGLILGTISMTLIMLLWNWLVTPLYMGVDRSVVIGMLAPVFLPFNLLKGGMNAAAAMLLYKPIVTALRKSGLVQSDGPAAPVKKKLTIGVSLASLFVLATLVLTVMVWTGVL